MHAQIPAVTFGGTGDICEPARSIRTTAAHARFCARIRRRADGYRPEPLRHAAADEERRLRSVVAAMRDDRFILEPSFLPTLPNYDNADVACHPRVTIGTAIANLVVAAAERSVSRSDPAPAAAIAVRPFEPDQGDEALLFRSARAVVRQRRAAPMRRQIDRLHLDPLRGRAPQRSLPGRWARTLLGILCGWTATGGW